MNKKGSLLEEIIVTIIGAVINTCLILALVIYLIWFSSESICLKIITFFVVTISYHVYYFHESFKEYMKEK